MDHYPSKCMKSFEKDLSFCILTIDFDIGFRENGDQFAIIRLSIMHGMKRSNVFVIICFSSYIVLYLYCIFQCKEPKLTWQVVLHQLVFGYVTNVKPVYLDQPILLLMTTWSSTDLGVWSKESKKEFTNKAKVTIDNNFSPPAIEVLCKQLKYVEYSSLL